MLVIVFTNLPHNLLHNFNTTIDDRPTPLLQNCFITVQGKSLSNLYAHQRLMWHQESSNSLAYFRVVYLVFIWCLQLLLCWGFCWWQFQGDEEDESWYSSRWITPLWLRRISIIKTSTMKKKPVKKYVLPTITCLNYHKIKKTTTDKNYFNKF